jgi:small subunit ribosomal protein S16
MGRRHRPFFRICAVDSGQARDGRVLEELGTYDPMVPDTDARAVLNQDRIRHWLSVGAQPTEKCGALIKKYGPEGTHLDQQREALDRLAQQRRRPEPPRPLAGDAEPEARATDDAGPGDEPSADVAAEADSGQVSE